MSRVYGQWSMDMTNLRLFLIGWNVEWDEISDKGCDNGEDESELYSDYNAKDTPKQMPKALQQLRNHLPAGGRLAPTPDDFQVLSKIQFSG